MLSVEEEVEVSGMIAVTMEILGQPPLSPGALSVMAGDLAVHSMPAIRRALTRCRKECRGRLSLSDIESRIQHADGRLTGDEAWAQALLSFDESQTVVWTPETQTALAAARPILEARDKIGARMAFKDAYDRAVQLAREEHQPTQWMVTLGSDAGLRGQAIAQAVQLGRITQERAEEYCTVLQLEPPEVSAQGLALSHSLLRALAHDGSPREAPSSAPVADEFRERLRQLRADVAEHSAWRQEEAELWELAIREDLQRRKADALQQVARVIDHPALARA